VDAIRRRARRGFQVDFPSSEAAFIRVLPAAEVLFAWGLARRHVDKAVALRWLHTPLSGIDRLLNPELMRTAILITSSRGVNSVAVAEHTFALLLSLTRGIAACLRAQPGGRWIQEDMYSYPTPLGELDGKLLGILGLGGIGKEIAVRARAFGMSVWAVTRSGRSKYRGVDRLLPATRAEVMFRRADIVVLAAPLTDETQGVIGERQLRSMKRTALLINVGRGELVQESALIRALRERWIAGAGLDVFATEPLGPASPLWRMPQVVVTPHIAGTHPDYIARAVDLFLANLKRYQASQPLQNEIDRQAGY
jgi:phosphoglycerate dehydrogenase-like enzyme